MASHCISFIRLPSMLMKNRSIYVHKHYDLKADMKSYIPLETAAIFFSSEPFSKTGYKLGVCHG